MPASSRILEGTNPPQNRMAHSTDSVNMEGMIAFVAVEMISLTAKIAIRTTK